MRPSYAERRAAGKSGAQPIIVEALPFDRRAVRGMRDGREIGHKPNQASSWPCSTRPSTPSDRGLASVDGRIKSGHDGPKLYWKSKLTFTVVQQLSRTALPTSDGKKVVTAFEKQG